MTPTPCEGFAICLTYAEAKILNENLLLLVHWARQCQALHSEE